MDIKAAAQKFITNGYEDKKLDDSGKTRHERSEESLDSQSGVALFNEQYGTHLEAVGMDELKTFFGEEGINADQGKEFQIINSYDEIAEDNVNTLVMYAGGENGEEAYRITYDKDTNGDNIINTEDKATYQKVVKEDGEYFVYTTGYDADAASENSSGYLSHIIKSKD